MSKTGKLPSYPSITGIEGFTKNKVVGIEKKLFGNPIYWEKKEDGMNVGCYLDENKEMQIRTSEQEHISEDMRERFLKLPYAQNIKNVLETIESETPDKHVIIFGEYILRGKSPKRIGYNGEDSFKAFDIYIEGLCTEHPFLKWDSFSNICDVNSIPRVDLIEITTVNSLEELLTVRERLFTLCKENRWEGVVGKVWVTNEFGTFVNLVKEKPIISKIPNPKNPDNDLPELPDSEITGAIEKVLCNHGLEFFENAKLAMPQIAIMVKEQCEKHGCKKPGERVYSLYRDRLMRM